MLDELEGKGFDVINGIGVANDTFGMSYDVMRAASSSTGTSSAPASASTPVPSTPASKIIRINHLLRNNNEKGYL